MRIGDIEDPTPEELGTYQADHVGESIPFTIERDGRPIELTLTPVLDEIDGAEIPRIGVLLEPAPISVPSAVVAGYVDVWEFTKVSIGEIGRVFGPEGIGRMVRLLFTDEERTQRDPASVVGIGQQVGAIGSDGDWEYVGWIFGYVTLFIGLINLVPLPPLRRGSPRDLGDRTDPRPSGRSAQGDPRVGRGARVHGDVRHRGGHPRHHETHPATVTTPMPGRRRPGA